MYRFMSRLQQGGALKSTLITLFMLGSFVTAAASLANPPSLLMGFVPAYVLWASQLTVNSSPANPATRR